VPVTENTLASGAEINNFVESVVRCAARGDTSHMGRIPIPISVTPFGFPDAAIGGLVKTRPRRPAR